MDSIIAKGMTFSACHGMEEQERNLAQRFKIDLEMFMDLELAGQTDDIENTINYARVFDLVQEVVTSTSYDLIEALAENIARTLLIAFPLMRGLEITVYKPDAPIQGEFDYFAVKIFRFQK